jgi:ketosteroid isomerase-like protein
MTLDRTALVGAMVLMIGGNVHATTQSVEADRKAVADLDTKYQAAVEKNDAETMAKIHHEDMVLVVSSGAVITGKMLEQRARSQVVRVLGDTAVVTAKLWIKGTRGKDAIDYKVWFSDTYVRTPAGWRYFVGQAGAPIKE